eukprot:1232613-Prymnesium_polylepis.2
MGVDTKGGAVWALTKRTSYSANLVQSEPPVEAGTVRGRGHTAHQFFSGVGALTDSFSNQPPRIVGKMGTCWLSGGGSISWSCRCVAVSTSKTSATPGSASSGTVIWKP